MAYWATLSVSSARQASGVSEAARLRSRWPLHLGESFPYGYFLDEFDTVTVV